jgi:hypothetical protein
VFTELDVIFQQKISPQCIKSINIPIALPNIIPIVETLFSGPLFLFFFLQQLSIKCLKVGPLDEVNTA